MAKPDRWAYTKMGIRPPLYRTQHMSTNAAREAAEGTQTRESHNGGVDLVRIATAHSTTINIDIIDMRRDGHDMDRRPSPTGIRYTKTTASTEPQT